MGQFMKPTERNRASPKAANTEDQEQESFGLIPRGGPGSGESGDKVIRAVEMVDHLEGP